jgi:hypothetical protein
MEMILVAARALEHNTAEMHAFTMAILERRNNPNN